MQHIRTWFGIFGVNENQIVSCDIYPKDHKTLVERLHETPHALSTCEVCGTDIRTLAKGFGFVGSDQEYDELFHKVSIRYARDMVKESVSSEQILIQSIRTMDDLDAIINALTERLKELYDLNFPELGVSGEELARFIVDHGARSDLKVWDVEVHIRSKARYSGGIELPEPVEKNIIDMAVSILRLTNNRNQFSHYIETYMNTAFINLSAITGAHIGARLISIAGSARKLAMMPSSTVQVLGAERALFKHRKGNASSPKHGVIFQHPFIRESPKRMRGRAARLLASRISMAIRADCYSKEYRKGLVEDLNRRVDTMRQQYSRPAGK